jgi:hypothetical protein
MSTYVRRSCISALLAFTLTSCATNSVLREDAVSLSAELASVQTQTREFYAKQSAAREDYLLRIIAEDPKCMYGFPIYIVVESPPTRKVRCANKDELDALNEENSIATGSAYLFGLPDKSDQAALELVSVVAEYQAVVAKIVEDPKFDSKQDLKDLSERADALRDRYGDLLNVGKEPRTESIAEELNAAAALADLIRKAYHDGQAIEKLRQLVSKEGVAVEAALKSLSLRYRNHDALLLNNLEAHRAATRQREFNEQLSKTIGSAERLKILRAFSAEQRSASQQLTKTDPLAVALEGLAKTHEEFRRALLAGELTEDQRRRIAKQTLENLRAWFNVMKQVAVLL